MGTRTDKHTDRQTAVDRMPYNLESVFCEN